MNGCLTSTTCLKKRLPHIETCAVDFFPSKHNYLDRGWQRLGRGKSEGKKKNTFVRCLLAINWKRYAQSKCVISILQYIVVLFFPVLVKLKHAIEKTQDSFLLETQSLTCEDLERHKYRDRLPRYTFSLASPCSVPSLTLYFTSLSSSTPYCTVPPPQSLLADNFYS